MFMRYARCHKRNWTIARMVRIMPMRQYRNDVMGTKISTCKDATVVVRAVSRSNTLERQGGDKLPTYELYGEIPVFGYFG